MTQRIEPAPIKGGPLDGQTFRPVTRWPNYLDASGEPLAAKHGDRIMSGRDATSKGCYILERFPSTSYGWREAKS
jgi:hypothetical protein